MTERNPNSENGSEDKPTYREVKGTLFTYGIGKGRSRKTYRFFVEGLDNCEAIKAYEEYLRIKHKRSDPQKCLEEMTILQFSTRENK
ncbi:hypothetical protein COU59_00465 [Candidatus Pacearchaeota archaeon CG10_big_fil_rev_8_21_14_0_10_34_12]|nr:MAG: hypothetical protein COU59_00465 [Candidatus Pacearchaeota archaeon CG10_big_fil_rev_8_21_14_0_10_34_12]